jgi:predicted enzyme related to lactoylglutathione lyase
MPMPSGTYTMVTLSDKQIAGLMKLPEEAKKMGAPPHWLSYVAVDDAQRATDKAKELGGKVLAGPMSVGPGTMSVIQDPTGAVFALWASQQSMGTILWREVRCAGASSRRPTSRPRRNFTSACSAGRPRRGRWETSSTPF